MSPLPLLGSWSSDFTFWFGALFFALRCHESSVSKDIKDADEAACEVVGDKIVLGKSVFGERGVLSVMRGTPTSSMSRREGGACCFCCENAGTLKEAGSWRRRSLMIYLLASRTMLP